ncbi:hypothetical protein CSPAE12_03238 [Colletotrichum incanum]|nr:hypothetical protein CSPAE12_03238 [Colletotrichum incanum]
MHQPPPADQSTFESRAQYNLQATDDFEEEHNELEKKRPPPVPKRPNYRPKPLRWPFIVCMIFVLSVLMGLVVYARETMPNSDSTATIEPRHILRPRQEPSSAQQQLSTSKPLLSSTREPTPSQAQASTPHIPTSLSSPIEQNTPTPTQAIVPSSSVELLQTSEQKESSKPSSTPMRSQSQVSMPQAPSASNSGALPNTPISAIISSTGVGALTNAQSTPSKVSLSIGSGSDVSTQSVMTTSEPDGLRQMKDISTSISSNSGGNNVFGFSTDQADQRKRPPTGTVLSGTSILISSSLATPSPSTSLSTMRRPTGDDEIVSITTSTFTSTLTRIGSTFTYSTHYTTLISSTFTTVIPTTFPGRTGTGTFTTVTATPITRTTTRSQPGSSFMTTMTMPVTTTRVISISNGPKTTFLTTTETETRVVTSPVVVTAGVTVETTTEYPEPSGNGDIPASTGFYTSTGVNAVQTTIATVATSTGPSVVYVSVGTTEITLVSTIRGGSIGQQNIDPTPVTHVVTSVFDQRVVTVVETGAPQRLVVSDGSVFTAVFTPPPETIVMRSGGQETQMVITVTPSLNAAFVAVPTVISGKSTVVMVESTFDTGGAFKGVATTIDGKATVVEIPTTPEAVLIAMRTTIDGKPTVLLVKSTPTAGFKPVSLTLVSQVGGSTGIFTTTDPPEIIKTVVDGKETTIVRTPNPREFTSVVGGTPTTVEMVTTPSGSMPLSFTVITTIGGTVGTIVSTPKPITLVTSISGKLSTITSTPEPTSRLSTIKASTATLTSVSTPTSTESADNVITKVEKYGFTNGDYFVGKFLPVILAVMITIPLRIIDLNAKLYQPFFAMAQEGGALGRNSIALQFDGWKGLLAPFKVLMQGHPVPFITTLMLWSSAMLVPLATEAIGMKLHGKCKITAIEGCGIQLGVSTMSAHALVALLACITVLLLVLLYFLRNWETGLHANPWSIVGISSLVRNADIRPHDIDFNASKTSMSERNYMLGYFENSQGRDEYGIIYCDDSSQNLQAAASGALPADDELDGTSQRNILKNTRKPVPFIALTYWWRLGFIFFLASLVTLVLYYHITLQVRTSFKDVTDSQTWGVRFFLSALGVIIVFCWESIFVSIAIISPFYHMDRHSQQPESSILLTRPTNSFYGIYAAILEGNVVLMLAAFMAILAEFLPILLTNIPYNLTQTLATHNICALTSVSILVLMLITLVASLFIKWPDMPADPRSIAGIMYYINESRMLEDFEGLSKLISKDREKKVKKLGRRYFYGAISGKDGRRMGVESIESVEDTAYTGGHWFLPQTEVNHREDHHEDTLQHELGIHERHHEIEQGEAQMTNNREMGLV